MGDAANVVGCDDVRTIKKDRMKLRTRAESRQHREDLGHEVPLPGRLSFAGPRLAPSRPTGQWLSGL